MTDQPEAIQEPIIDQLRARFADAILAQQQTKDNIPTLWCRPERIGELLRYAKTGVAQPFRQLYDLTAIDERWRTHRDGQPAADFTVVYHLLSHERNADLRIKVPLTGEFPRLPTATGIWSAANWYEREVWDMFGITFDGHPGLRRILLPATWQGHPLRKEHPARATEMGPFQLPEEKQIREEDALRLNPQEWGLDAKGGNTDLMLLNLGPQHPGTHGVFRIALLLDGEEIVQTVPEIGFHHRGAEKMAERQTWHTYIPYTDRIDYLGGVMNNLPYVLAVEKLAGITVPDRAKVIRVMLVELFRIASHLVWYGTFVQDVGAMSPVFYMFNDRERIFDIITAITGGRMHPSWFRIGGVAQDLPQGWEKLVEDFLRPMPEHLQSYNKAMMENSILKARTQGIGRMSLDEAIDWGVTGPNLRACGLEWDWRKKRPYSGYEQFEFEIPTAQCGDCYDRSLVRIEEIRQSLRIIEQCWKNMPAGPYKADHPLTTPPRKERTLKDIETLINHFLGVTWGPVLPPGEVSVGIEATKGNTSYYLISDGGIHSYRTRIRTPSFAHLQQLPELCRGLMVPDLLAIIGNLDYVMADVDR
ncbi:MAG: NADH-quinone oxidoreductase subunit C/D [Desulfobacteraceae bacterium]|nr:NADH-quinone oxidoreductase subunit C/D [Desulfobacteraceae bacterium]